MTTQSFTRDLAAEHNRDLRQQAADYRMRTAAASDGRHLRANPLSLRVRPTRPEDIGLMAAIFDGLSPGSRLARYLIPKRKLTTAELRYFTDVDHHDHEALIAVTRVRGEAVGVARYVRSPEDRTSADVAVEVVDDWQGRGVGSMLVARLALRARCEGITAFTPLMSADNRRSLRLMTKTGRVTDAVRDGATVTYRVELPVTPIPAQRRPAPRARTGYAS